MFFHEEFIKFGLNIQKKLEQWRDISYSWIRRLSDIKMLGHPNSIDLGHSQSP